MKRLLLALCLLAAPLAAQPSRFSLATQVQPGFATTALGDTYYALNATTFGRLAGNTTTTRKFWCQVGTGSVSAAPEWCGPSDFPTLNQDTTGSAAKWTTARLLAGNSVDGSGNVAFSNKFILQGTTDAGMTAAQFLGALGTGVLKNTTTTGVLSIAAPGDFPMMVASGSSHAAGMVGDPGASAGSTKFWREDATFAVPAGGGGGSGTVDGISTVTLVAGTGMTISDNTPGAGQITLTSSGGGGSSYAGTLWIGADPNFTTGTSYERVRGPVGTGLLQLAPQRTWNETIANALSTPPGGWTWANIARAASADENTTTSGALHIVTDSTGTDWNGSSPTALWLYKTYAAQATPSVFVTRIKLSNAGTTRFIGFVYAQDGAPGTEGRMLVYNDSGSTCELYTDVNGYSVATVSATTTQCGQGVWYRLTRTGTAVLYEYSFANQATPPTSWTTVNSNGAEFSAAAAVRVGFTLGGGGAPITAEVLYYDESALNVATGFDSTSPVLTLVGGFDLGGSGATVTDANAQAALVEITSPRESDTAAWTWSVSRGSSAPVSCGGGSYAAAASVTVGGTGRYLSVCGKAASDGTQPASVNATALRVPFTP
jgi:hypothetical protein